MKKVWWSLLHLGFYVYNLHFSRLDLNRKLFTAMLQESSALFMELAYNSK